MTSRILLLAVAGSLFVSANALAQSLAAPKELKADGQVLSWKHTPVAGVKYLIERSGPGLTFFTQIAGPISETSYSIETEKREAGATYTYRVRAVDAASNLSSYSNSVSAQSPFVARNLPLVGNDPIALLATLPGYRPNPLPDYTRTLPPSSAQADSASFVLKGVMDGTFSFTSADGSQSFSWGCAGCSFVVGPDGVGPASRGNSGMEFKLSPNGVEISLTCRASRCDVVTARQIEIRNGVLNATTAVVFRQVGADQTQTIPSTVQAFFAVTAQ
jgi:hypothetical protein